MPLNRFLFALVLLGLALVPPALAQPQDSGPMDDAARRAEQALSEPGDAPAASQPAPTPVQSLPEINLFEMFLAGGIFMWPILGMSIVVVLFTLERLLGLRRRKILAPELVEGLSQLSRRKGGLDPRLAYKLCQQYPSAGSTVLRIMFLKTGRPLVEVEQAVKDGKEREAARLYKNVRPIALGVTVTPLLGLLGTVQGMILSFMITAAGQAGQNKAESLAQGIYIALITTFAGLCVAIPAAVLAHYFEGRIQARFRELDELILGILPQLERFEGKLRMGKDGPEGETPSANGSSPAAAPARQPARSAE
jgi:biopolymer transport protein ExbB